MEICTKCSIRAGWECECSELLCLEHRKIHEKELSGHTIQKIQLYWAPDAQNKASKRISNQLKSLELCCHHLSEITSDLMKEISKLKNESLQLIQEKKAELLNLLDLTKKKISAKELKNLEILSEIVLIKQNQSLTPLKSQLQQFYKVPMFKKYNQLEELQNIEYLSIEKTKTLIEQNYKRLLDGDAYSWVGGVAISSDNKYIVSASFDKVVRVWNLQNKAHVIFLQGHLCSISGLAISSDNKYVVSGSGDRTVRVWDIQDVRYKETVFQGHTSCIHSVGITRNNKFIVSSSDGFTVWVWKLKKLNLRNPIV